LVVEDAHMAHGLHHVSGAGLALGAEHGRALCKPPAGLSQIAAAADKRHLELPFVDVVERICGGKDFAFRR